MTTDMDLFGTVQPHVVRDNYAVGPWTITVEDGALRHIKLHGVEAIRGIAFLVRDRDWGTLVPAISNLDVVERGQALHLSYDAVFVSQDARLDVRVALDVTPQNLSFAATGQATGHFETNRAGFTVLHPITDVAGHPVRVTHGDGTITDGAFPALIAPWQPFKDMTALSHHAGGAVVTCQFHGDTFEMEDQRQWGDASFKTYNRPLAKPWPYTIAPDDALDQAVTLTWEKADPLPAVPTEPLPSGVAFPDTALVMTPDDARRLSRQPDDLARVQPQRLLCHLDASLGDVATQCAAFGAAQAACREQTFDLEYICRCDTAFDCALDAEFASLAEHLQAAAFVPASIMVCPSVDRQSTPPGSDWPDCPPLRDIHAAAARAFPTMLRGGGMVSFFPELNRKRPPCDMLGFVSHGLCPIVHAADDLSVMETLEAIPHITRTARAIIGGQGYRIGPATLAMRQNPYGARTIPNPDQQRVCMADDDPRHSASFGAAYCIGLATALATAGVSVWTPAALYGPRGVIAEQGQWPIAQVLGCLAELAGQTVHMAQIKDGIAQLCIGDTELTANLTAQPVGTLPPYGWATRAT